MEKIKGGKADNLRPEQFNSTELLKGVKVELEHTDDVAVALEIAMDHLVEDPNYYKKLAKIHKESFGKLCLMKAIR